MLCYLTVKHLHNFHVASVLLDYVKHCSLNLLSCVVYTKSFYTSLNHSGCK